MKNKHGNIRKILKYTLIFTICFCQAFSSFAENAHTGNSNEQNLSLEEAVMIAIQNSYEVKLARLDLYIAETGVMYSEAVFDTFLFGGSSYMEDKSQQLSVFAADDSQTNTYYAGLQKTLPTGTEIKGQWGDTRYWDSGAFLSKNPGHTAELMFELKQPLGENMFGYIDRTNISISKLAVKNASLQEKDRIEVMIARVEDAYCEFLFTMESLEVDREILEKAKTLHESNAKNYDMGLLEKVDLLASEAYVINMETLVLVAENDFSRAEENLKLIMNLGIEDNVFPTDSLSAVYTNADIAECFRLAFENRRDYLAAKRDAEIKGLELKIKTNEKWPEIDLILSAAANGAEGSFEKAFGKTTVLDNTKYYAGIEVTIPIENKADRSQYDSKKYEKEEALIAIKEVEREIITEVTNAAGDVNAYGSGAESLKKVVELQKEKLEEEEKRFSTGRSNTKRVIDYQQDLLQAELEEMKLRLNHAKAVVSLERAMNIILGKYEEKI